MKRTLLILGGLIVLGGVVFASIRAGEGKKGIKIYAEAAARRPIQQVVKATGEINPRIKVNISAHVIGKIEKLYVNEGDWIEKGKPFLELEKNIFVADRDQWAAQLASAGTGVQQAEVTLADSQIKLDRAQRLKREGITTIEQLEGAVLAEHSARLKLLAAKEAVTQTRANLVRAQTDLGKTTIYAPLTGRVITLNAKEGEVVVSGTMNNPASIIATIADLTEVLAEVDVDETEIVNVAVGQHATLKVDALPKHLYHGRVTEVGSSGYNRANQPDVTFFKVKVLLADSDPQLRSGMSARAEIETQAHGDALTVPIQSVVERPPLAAKGSGDRGDHRQGSRDKGNASGSPKEISSASAGGDRRGGAKGAGAPGGASTAGAGGGQAQAAKGAKGAEEVKVVFVITAGKVHQRKVETGISDETHVEILSGLQPGEQVVTGPYRSLRELKESEAVQIGKPSEEKTDNQDKKDAEDKDSSGRGGS
ncbi:MAG TPA: efflux RND transporter periplasmic adaptor subunit [Thermoanaerobaculia bacterium]|nr:efflux RND transporter periplasmic adaptor subunit [Thermoanaerobaculia bacterium]